jgi:hypothetical protein
VAGVGVGVDNTGDYEPSAAVQDLFRSETFGLVGRAYNTNASLVDSDRGVSKHTPLLVHGDNGRVVDKDVEFHLTYLCFAAPSNGSENMRRVHMGAYSPDQRSGFSYRKRAIVIPPIRAVRWLPSRFMGLPLNLFGRVKLDILPSRFMDQGFAQKLIHRF